VSRTVLDALLAQAEKRMVIALQTRRTHRVAGEAMLAYAIDEVVELDAMSGTVRR